MFRYILIILLSLIEIIIFPLPGKTEQTNIALNVNFNAKVTYIIKSFKTTLPSKTTITYTRVPRGVIVSVAEKEFFSPNSTKSSENGKILLRNIASVLSSFNNKCTVESHTEEKLPQNSIYKEDWEISIVRATAITNFITKCCGVDSERLTPIGFGDIMPFKGNVSAKNFSNNRIDFVIFDYSTTR